MTTTGQAALIGGGVIGGGWAARFLLNGWDVNVFAPKFTGPKKPKSIGPGDNLRFVATVGKFTCNSCLFFLDPAATMSR